MRTIIAGSRTIARYDWVRAAMQLAANRGITPVTQVLCGMARGVDLLGLRWAHEHFVPVRECPAEWVKNGVHDRSAGIKRNCWMGHNADALVALWDGHSPGTKHMIDFARKQDLKVFVFDPKRWAE